MPSIRIGTAPTIALAVYSKPLQAQGLDSTREPCHSRRHFKNHRRGEKVKFPAGAIVECTLDHPANLWSNSMKLCGRREFSLHTRQSTSSVWSSDVSGDDGA
jgi:hypothetical protein